MLPETERLYLRQYTPDDFDGLYAILSDPVTMAHYPKPYDETGTRRWLQWSFDNYKTYGFGLWAVILKETGTFLGDCGLTIQQIDGEYLPEIGYHIRRDYWRRGYGQEAARAVRDWAFTHTDYPCLYSYMTAGNLASQATAASMGMRKIKEYIDDHYEATCVYAITRSEWESRFQTVQP